MTGVLVKPELQRMDEGSSESARAAERSSRKAWFDGGFVETPVFDRELLRSGNRIAGPALVEEHASTTVLLSTDTLVVDAAGNLLIEVGAA